MGSPGGVCAGTCPSVQCFGGYENSLEDVIVGFGVETLEMDHVVCEIERAERTDRENLLEAFRVITSCSSSACECLCKHLCVA